ncbi:hypothetical protein FOVG_01385 [Fusarium oxysporum f. sp. pisi HDV247]|uniref:Uncharacterized protein n=1 Tax=Fusarium oxysporum f. sp. pisi HDV247 TaxID=1080344 RepID=W9QRX2_FUSOX|nr:hypothetical protein FOVG_01385 [Fusarium oxysporum f. sp. pisi HDV247]
MEFVGVKAARFILAILTFIQWASCQTTAASDVVGFVVEEGSPITTISCGPEMAVYTYSEFLFCEFPGRSKVGTACGTEWNVLYTEIQGSELTEVCYEYYPCISATVVEDWADGGATYTVVGCMDSIGLYTPVSTLYQNKPTDLPSGFTEAVSTALDDSSTVLGFVVEEGSPITTISCPNDWVVHTHSKFLFCDYPVRSIAIGTACDSEGNQLYTVIQGSEATYTCYQSPCISVTVVEDWADGGATYTVFDCMDSIGLHTPVSTLYQNKPTDLPSGFTESEAPVSTIDSEPWNRPNEEGDDKREDGGPSVGVIVGTALASVVLIIAAIFLGIRIRRKRAESRESGSQPQGSKGSGEGLRSLPRPTVSVSRSHRPKEAEKRQENLTMQPIGTDNAPAKVQAKSKNSPVEMEARIEENLRAELGTGKDAQGWARGGTNAVPYELDATTPADAKTR